MASVPRRKRTRDASPSPGPSNGKKARTSFKDGADLVASILSQEVEGDDEVAQLFAHLARYARTLEEALEEVVELIPRRKTQDEIDAEAEKLRVVVVSGIRKQMTWRRSCESSGGTRWTYDGVCADPEVFASLLKLDGPMKYKTKQMPLSDFQDAIGHVKGRYHDLYFVGTHVSIKWNPDQGTFKFTGDYGGSRINPFGAVYRFD